MEVVPALTNSDFLRLGESSKAFLSIVGVDFGFNLKGEKAYSARII